MLPSLCDFIQIFIPVRLSWPQPHLVCPVHLEIQALAVVLSVLKPLKSGWRTLNDECGLFKCDCWFSFLWFYLQFRLFVYAEVSNFIAVRCCWLQILQSQLSLCVRHPSSLFCLLLSVAFSRNISYPCNILLIFCYWSKNVPTWSSASEVDWTIVSNHYHNWTHAWGRGLSKHIISVDCWH